MALTHPIVVTADNHRFYENHPAVTALERCKSEHQLKQVHAQMLRAGVFSDPFSASKLIQSSSLSENSSLSYAQQVFDQIPQPNLFSWNALIRAYASSPNPIQSIRTFIRLLHCSVEKCNKFTYPFAIKASAKLGNLGLGKGVHGMVIKEGFSSDLFVGNCLIHFYAECGCPESAKRIFLGMPERDLVSWNSIINGLAQNECADDTMRFFQWMAAEGVKPNDVTMMGILSIAAKKMDIELGKLAHSYSEKNGVKMGLILSNAILDMYTKCGSINDARILFDKMAKKDAISYTTMLVGYAKMGDFSSARHLFDSLPCKDIASWNALISAYEQSHNPKEAITVFDELRLRKAAKPDEITFVSALSACSQMGSIYLGRKIHSCMKNEGVRLNTHLCSSLIDMYSKCGDLQKALDVFHSFDSKKDVYVWSAMIAGLGMHGQGREAVKLFSKMKEAKVSPSSVTFTNVLSACSHSGLVDEGREIFLQMENPRMEHYASMVDILGRAGLMEEAMELVESMPVEPEASVWSSLLGSCKLHRNVEVAEYACKRLLEIEPQNHGAYVLLSNVYAVSGEWEKVSLLRKTMRDAGLKKEPGRSWIEVEGVVHEFLVGDNTHFRRTEIYEKLDEVVERLKFVGYDECDKSDLLQVVDDGSALRVHSERLAIAYGLISLGPSEPIRVMKNLRVCADCHTVAKLVSEVYGREIVIRDRYRFHRFKDGVCSCKDYW